MSVSLTVVHKGLVSHDAQISDNGDATLTVRQLSPARVAVLGPDGRTVAHFSGLSITDGRLLFGTIAPADAVRQDPSRPPCQLRASCPLLGGRP